MIFLLSNVDGIMYLFLDNVLLPDNKIEISNSSSDISYDIQFLIFNPLSFNVK